MADMLTGFNRKLMVFYQESLLAVTVSQCAQYGVVQLHGTHKGQERVD